ncbi:RagB/SusD family nutrient uptake outer membrane protein [Hymenobacter sp. BT491]|uniref:RagB/SusD family nutrient uptake outer membrane protein n=1 Tax=Hymenobacter sp. BT491 TaxID=2766779 RepID=UPI001653D6F1|nr:RagB/SusD family nutrient uptake outer membrane protein [Hymenobacter sp. BT491]MBC6991210.1 RagB/SusD family nutrient uptake outer membrane protein [Hymenobacter sp. BT491]
MKNKILLLVLAATFASCNKDFLDEQPKASLSSTDLNNLAAVEALITAAYAPLGGQIDDANNAFNSPGTNWTFGDVVSDDAYKGGGGVGDQNGMHLMEIFLTNANIIDVERKWRACYEGIARVNRAIQAVNGFAGMTDAQRTTRLGELHLLRGHYYFDLKKIYNHIPWVDETPRAVTEYDIPNNLSDAELWKNIENEFLLAQANLPAKQTDLGRVTKGSATAYLAKLYLYTKDYPKVITTVDALLATGLYRLNDNYHDNFDPTKEHGPESLFAIERSIRDGTPNNFRGSLDERLLNPGGPYYPVYGFDMPSQDLVNAFKTTAAGLPQTDKSDVGATDFVDPRLDHTVGRPGVQFLDLAPYAATWARDAGTYGVFAFKKRMVSSRSALYLNQFPWVSALNYDIIRLADVLLFKAEAQAETGNLEGARTIVNQIRRRAANDQVLNANGTPAANYKVAEYAAPFANQEAARQAVRTERRLEMALEGQRFFDLVRWGIADQVMNEHFAREKTKRTYLATARFVKGTHEYFPIPQSQLNLSKGLLKQNAGY